MTWGIWRQYFLITMITEVLSFYYIALFLVFFQFNPFCLSVQIGHTWMTYIVYSNLTKTRMHESINEWMSQWINESMKQSINQLIDSFKVGVLCPKQCIGYKHGAIFIGYFTCHRSVHLLANLTDTSKYNTSVVSGLDIQKVNTQHKYLSHFCWATPQSWRSFFSVILK